MNLNESFNSDNGDFSHDYIKKEEQFISYNQIDLSIDNYVVED